MFIVEKSFSFEAGHVLEHHDGQCSDPHGHSYVVSIQLKVEILEKDGPKKNMAIDFLDISKIVRPMIDEYFEHKWLNDTLETDSPTAEFIASWIYQYLVKKLPYLTSVMVQETATSKVIYIPSV